MGMRAGFASAVLAYLDDGIHHHFVVHSRSDGPTWTQSLRKVVPAASKRTTAGRVSDQEGGGTRSVVWAERGAHKS